MAQRVYKFRAATLDEAYREVRKRLGEDAVVKKTTEVPMKGLLGMLGRSYVEVTAHAPAKHQPAPSQPSRMESASRKPSSVERRYMDQLRPTGSLAQDPSVAYYEQLVSQAQERIAANKQAKEQQTPQPQDNHRVVPFPKQPEETDNVETMRQQMLEMREMLQVLMAESPGSALPPEYADHYRALIDAGVTRKVAAALVAAAGHESDEAALRDPMVFRERLKVEIRKRVKVTGGIATAAGQCRFVALVGATGVGKTTSVAKLAARYALNERMKVAMLTADTYRVAAADQLMKYANIIGIPMKVIHDAKEMAEARREFADYDLVLMDTAGGSQFNTKQIQELKLVLTAAQPDGVVLVLSSNTQYDDMKSMAANFGCLKPSSVLFTKLDETRKFGGMLNILMELDKPLSFLSTGQNVPDDIVLAHPGMVANLVLEGRDRRGRPSTTSP